MKRLLPLLPTTLAVLSLPSVAAEPTVTFTKNIAPLIFENCTVCHRAGEVGPFPLTTFAEVKKKAETIATALSDRVMPPWRADEGAAKFHDARVLQPEQIALFEQWVKAGLPEGAATDLPPMPKFPAGWALGEPDLILKPAQLFPIPAEGRDLYQAFVLPTSFAADRYVSAVQVRPGNARVVHHVLLFLDTSGKARARDAASPEPGYLTFGGPGFLPNGSLGGWAPGNFPRHLPDGLGMRLPKGADVVMQVHYHPTGKAETDTTQIGIYLAKQPVEKRIRVFPIRARRLDIPAGEANYRTEGWLPIPADVTLQAIMPHMHLIGREMTVTARLPDGSEKKLIHVPDWNFNWQMTYRFLEPVKLPRGTMLHLTARFDNSADNPRNPSQPPRPVRRGEGTTDEMCMAFLSYTVDAEHIPTDGEAAGFPDTYVLAR